MEMYNLTGLINVVGRDEATGIYSPMEPPTNEQNHNVGKDETNSNNEVELYLNLVQGCKIQNINTSYNGCVTIILEKCEHLFTLETNRRRIAQTCLKASENINENTVYMSDDTSIIFLSLQYLNESNFVYDGIHLDILSESIQKFNVCIELQTLKFGSHLIEFQDKQLFICFYSPITITHINCGGITPEISSWKCTDTASRFLVCRNIVAIIDNYRNHKTFKIISFIQKNTFEHTIYRPDILTVDKYDVPFVGNVNGQIVWVAVKGNKVDLLSLEDETLTSLKSFCFDKDKGQREIIKDSLLYKKKLYVPMLTKFQQQSRELEVTPEQDKWTGYEIAIIHLETLKCEAILKGNFDFDIFKDKINLNFHHNKVMVEALRIDSGRTRLLFTHSFLIFPPSLYDAVRLHYYWSYDDFEIRRLKSFNSLLAKCL